MNGFRGWAAGLAVLLLVVSCSSPPTLEELGQEIDDRAADADPAPVDEPVAPDPDPDPEPEPDDPFAIPEEIDAAYVDLVMNELLSIDSEILRSVLSREAGDALTENETAALRALFSGPRLVKSAQDFLDYSRMADARVGFIDPEELGRMGWESEQVLHADESCVVVIGWFDITTVAVQPYPEDEFTVASLSPVAPSVDEAINATPWRIHDMAQLLSVDTGEPIPREDWHRLDYRGSMGTTCAEGAT